MVYVKYNRALKRRSQRTDVYDPILLQEIDESNEWLMGRMDKEIDEDDFTDIVHDDLTWGDVNRYSGASEPVYATRSSRPGSSRTDKGKANAASTSSSRIP